MASIGSASRLSIRLASRQLRNYAPSRGFKTAAPTYAAHNLAMPALSPTMTEGNIATWKVKEGDSFSAGDVILEVETDKATMDVEAQDDGVMARIMQGDGSKAVSVGTRIAVLADEGDDISSLEIPPENNAQKPAPEKPAESQPASQNSESTPAKSSAPKESAGTPTKQTYPLYPSVQTLLRQNGLNIEDANKIPASGPSGRLLKGDVLAYLGQIQSSYSADQSARIKSLGHLDLSNIKVAPAAAPAPKPEVATPSTKAAPAPEPDTEVALPISLSAVLECQKRMQDTLGIHLPTATFIARAIELANEDLPRSKIAKPTADELFNSVLGLDKVGSNVSRGSFSPQITALGAKSIPPSRPNLANSKKIQADVYDLLTGGSKKNKAPAAPRSRAVQTTMNVFSVSAKKGDERRAMTFLERVKSVLEAEPGRLVV